MKTGEPIYPLLNDRGEKLAEITNYTGRAQIKYKDGLVDYDIPALHGIIIIMEEMERQWNKRYETPEPEIKTHTLFSVPRDRE